MRSQKAIIKRVIKQSVLLIVITFISHLYLQWMQNQLSVTLVYKFAFQWHVAKFWLSTAVLFVVLMWMIALLGSFTRGISLYLITIVSIGLATYFKMRYREEPLYPDDLRMITEWRLFQDILGKPLFIVIAISLSVLSIWLLYALWKSRKLSSYQQLVRVLCFGLMTGLLVSIGHFNQDNHWLKKQYSKTALWIPYSQKMNYYNTGFVAGFMYNLKVEAMEKPANYSQQEVERIVENYQHLAEEEARHTLQDQPNIVFIMSESFSDPLRLEGVRASRDPLAVYRELVADTYHGQMLSQNYGGGTANIEFEALTGFSMGMMNSQMTTPYTMLVPKMKQLPSVVSQLNDKGYYTSAIHPYNSSMYKRQDVYRKLGFHQFITEDDMTATKKVEHNPYISDEAALDEVYRLLKEKNAPQFIHLVTMQTHMPYKEKYPNTTLTADGDSQTITLANYMTDIEYTSQALADFLPKLHHLGRRTLVVFFGDHLPGIYSEAFKKSLPEEEWRQTEFFFYDSDYHLSFSNQTSSVLSPIYFYPLLRQQAQLPISTWDYLLLKLQEVLPAFEADLSYNGSVWQSGMKIPPKAKKLFADYQMLQYDILSGNQYSLNTTLFKELKQDLH